jgi:hypothetical protein
MVGCGKVTGLDPCVNSSRVGTESRTGIELDTVVVIGSTIIGAGFGACAMAIQPTIKIAVDVIKIQMRRNFLVSLFIFIIPIKGSPPLVNTGA